MYPALLTSVPSTSHVHLIIGANPLASSRCARSLEAGAKPILITDSPSLLDSLTRRITEGQVEHKNEVFNDSHLTTLGREEVDGVVDAVFVTLGRCELSAHIADRCRRLRIPVNVTDAPELCTFTLLATYNDGPLQIGITTSGRGCKMAGRIKREIAAALPKGIGDAVERLGQLRKRIWEEDNRRIVESENERKADGEIVGKAVNDEADDEEDTPQSATFNKLVSSSDAEAVKTKRIRWLSQICEYWPLTRLAGVTEEDVERILTDYKHSVSASTADSALTNGTLALDSPKRGTLILAGTGPGSPSLLTFATSHAIRTADLILLDKLVPSGVADLIPRRTPRQISRKFPGNADAAQREFLETALAAVKEGKTVLRLKQGDPYVYGRGGEEWAFFEEAGLADRVIVLPGMTSALSGLLCADIPATHRGVADSVLICTGTGRAGAVPDPPVWNVARTTIFLMALHRIETLVKSLTEAGWPSAVPVAVIERASCPDQRVIRTRLCHVVDAVQEAGSRPPGLLVVGHACEVLKRPGEGQRWSIEEGFSGFGEEVLGGEMGILGSNGTVSRDENGEREPETKKLKVNGT